jgi:hypothetical protein
MAEQFPALSEDLITWIDQQPIFFVGTAAKDGRVNLSPKGQDSLKVLSGNELLWLNLTGSGNETAAHLLDSNRITLMWCAFAGPPRILRVYGSAQTIHNNDADWQACTGEINTPVGARQFFKVTIDMVQTSCGYAVPVMDYVEDRKVLGMWSEKRGQAGIEEYWASDNTESIDGLPTGMP